MRPLWWENESVHILDQTHLPLETRVWTCTDYREVGRAIREMQVRGAPAIGIAAAMGMALAALQAQDQSPTRFYAFLEQAEKELAETRPTAVNLFWALERMRCLWEQYRDQEPSMVAQQLVDEACTLAEQDVETNQRLGEIGACLVPQGATLLTHCNAGALATGGFGTALGIARAAWSAGLLHGVVACETRPLLQGARLTAWELMQDGIDVTLITDNMAAALIAQGRVDLVVVGADCIAANGDVANKIGTYGLAVLAQAHGLAFYVAAPLSTFNTKLQDGSLITIEERSPAEVTRVGNQQVAPSEVAVWNPAFDVTPAHLVRGIVTEAGVLYPPYRETIARVLDKAQGV